MSMSTWPAVAGALGAVLSAAVAAVAAFWSRTAAQQANRAAEKASATADTIAEIEHQRRHQELTPKFRVRATIVDDSVRPGFAGLFVLFLDGQLDALDAVTITILNTVELRPWTLLDGVTEAEAEEVIWSGWEFDTFWVGSRDQRAKKATSNRQTKPRPFSRREGKDWYELLMRRTRPPRWGDWTEEKWRERYGEVPLRLSLECRLAGHEPWIVYKIVPIEPKDADPKSVNTQVSIKTPSGHIEDSSPHDLPETSETHRDLNRRPNNT